MNIPTDEPSLRSLIERTIPSTMDSQMQPLAGMVLSFYIHAEDTELDDPVEDKIDIPLLSIVTPDRGHVARSELRTDDFALSLLRQVVEARLDTIDFQTCEIGFVVPDTVAGLDGSFVAINSANTFTNALNILRHRRSGDVGPLIIHCWPVGPSEPKRRHGVISYEHTRAPG
jgi:hypothetical protein